MNCLIVDTKILLFKILILISFVVIKQMVDNELSITHRGIFMKVKYDKFFEDLKKDGSLSRFGKTFKSDSSYYFFDSGTGKVLECEKSEYEVLKQLTENNSTDFSDLLMDSNEIEKAIDNIVATIDNENIFKAEPIVRFYGGHFENLNSLILQNIQQIIFEVTEDCNLRCKYCIYHEENDKFRVFGKKYMDIDIAYKALDYVLENSYMPDLYVGFYGGEPLLNFEFIKKCVNYVLLNNNGKEITFSMTTNGTLITKEIAEYFASIPNFTITVSIDGDEEIHNENRVFSGGRGSFKATLNGIKNLKEAYGKDKQYCISLSSVISPPYTKEKFDRIQDFYIKNCQGMQSNITYVEKPYDKNRVSNKSQLLEDRMPLLLWDKGRNSLERRQSFTSGANLSALSRIHKRSITHEPNKIVSLNGCCIPGMRRLYVDVEGNFLPCERVGKSPYIGNVNTGLDFDSIEKYYVNDYVEKSLPDCSQCWAVPLCGLCYSHCYTEEGIDIERKRQACDDHRYSMMQHLIYYHELMKIDPEFINDLNNVEVV